MAENKINFDLSSALRSVWDYLPMKIWPLGVESVNLSFQKQKHHHNEIHIVERQRA